MLYSSKQHSEFTFLYNQLGPPASNSPAQYKHLAKQIGQGLALIEFVPQNVQRPASAFPCTSVGPAFISPPILTGTGTQTQIPEKSAVTAQAVPSLILLSGSQVALEEDIEALREHLHTAEKFSLIPIPPIPATPAIPTTGGTSPPRILTEPSDAPMKAQKVPHKSVSELLMKLYPTIPMQTQVLSDFCTACLEEALIVYSVERLISANGNGMISSIPVSASSTVSTASPSTDTSRKQMTDNQKLKTETLSPGRGALRSQQGLGLGLLEKEKEKERVKGKGSVVPLKVNIRNASDGSLSKLSTDAVGDRDRDRDRERRKDSNAGLSSLFTPVQDPLCVPFLHLVHSALCAAPVSQFFLNRSSGILHMPFLLPKHLSLSVRTQIIERIIDAHPALQMSSGEMFCSPLFLDKNVSDVSTESESKIIENQENIRMWCEAASSSNSVANSVNLTFFGASHLFPAVSSSSVALSVNMRSVSPSSASLLRRGEITSRSAEDELNGPVVLSSVSLPTSSIAFASTSTPALGHVVVATNSSNSIINNNNNNNNNNSSNSNSSSNANTSSSSQGDIRDRARANSNDRGRDRSSSFTPLMIPIPQGDLRSLVDYDSLIAGTLPLWLRRRAYSLEVAVTTDGIFLFFFNLSSSVLNSVCEISATVAAVGVRTYNEQIRHQLILLGILKDKVVESVTSPEVFELMINESDNVMTSSAAPSPSKPGSVTVSIGHVGGPVVGSRGALQASTGM